MQESPKVQENLDKAKVARRAVIRYIQVVQDEELVGTLLDANEKIVEAIQMYDRVSSMFAQSVIPSLSVPHTCAFRIPFMCSRGL